MVNRRGVGEGGKEGAEDSGLGASAEYSEHHRDGLRLSCATDVIVGVILRTHWGLKCKLKMGTVTNLFEN